MTNALQYICDSEGQTVSVVVPVAFWQELRDLRKNKIPDKIETWI